MIAAIVFLDAMTAAGVVVGLLLSIPIFLMSQLERPRPVLIATLVALLGFTLAAVVGTGPITPRAVWVPNRVLAVLAIIASCGIAILLQHRRTIADEALRSTLSARDTNRLLLSLMAHDLRTPLVAASQALEYVERAALQGQQLDSELLGDTRLRLRRSLRVIEQVLNVARDEMQNVDSPRLSWPHAQVNVVEEIEREIATFADEAMAQDKRIILRADRASSRAAVDARVLKQVLGILVDNAIRYANPGPVWVDLEFRPGRLALSVTDSGPGLLNGRSKESSGSGIGLELCRALAVRAGGRLDLEQDGEKGTRFCLHLPVLTRDSNGATSTAQHECAPYTQNHAATR